MPTVNVKGYGNVNFPNGMDVNDIRDSLRRRYSDQTNSDLLQSASKYGAPIGNVAAPYKPSLMERAGQGVADVLSDTGLISNRYGAQQIGKNVAAIGELLPGIGDAAAVDDFSRAAASGDSLGMGLAALGAIPVVGDLAGKAGKAAVDVANNIKPALPMDLTSRVGRAKGQDFDLNKTLYHGTKSDIENFDLAKTQSRDAGYIGEGVYLTGNKNLANFYAKSAATTGDSGSNVMPVVTNVKNTKTFTLGDKSKFAWDIKKNPKMSKELTEKLVGEGFDSAQVVDGKGELVEMVVFDPKNIRSKFAKFDPENKGKASLLGGLGALGVGIGLKSDEEYE
jgi:hypothetical protein